MNVYHALVPACAEGMSAIRYIQQAMPLLPVHVVRDAFAAKDVKCGGKRVGKDDPVIPGETVRLFTGFSAEIPIVYEDEAVLLLNKPAGINCGEDVWGGMTVLSMMDDRAKGAYAPRLCHRLDNATSGLLLLCKDDESEKLLREMFERRSLTKIYQCLVKGEMRPREAVKEAFLVKNSREGRVRIVTHETPGALPIATQYETLEYDGKISRLRVHLLTGRTHQIRAHLSFLSHPIWGDDKYGDRNFNKAMKANGLKLCATELTLYPEGKLSYLRDRRFVIEPPF